MPGALTGRKAQAGTEFFGELQPEEVGEVSAEQLTPVPRAAPIG